MARRITFRALRIRRRGREVQVLPGPKLFRLTIGGRRRARLARGSAAAPVRDVGPGIGEPRPDV